MRVAVVDDADRRLTARDELLPRQRRSLLTRSLPTASVSHDAFLLSTRTFPVWILLARPANRSSLCRYEPSSAEVFKLMRLHHAEHAQQSPPRSDCDACQQFGI